MQALSTAPAESRALLRDRVIARCDARPDHLIEVLVVEEVGGLPTPKPTPEPTPKPTVKPTPEPTVKPTVRPTAAAVTTPRPTPTPKYSPEYMLAAIHGDSAAEGEFAAILDYLQTGGAYCEPEPDRLRISDIIVASWEQSAQRETLLEWSYALAAGCG